VLTPAFFSRLVHYAHSSEVFDRECVFTDERNRIIWVSKPALLTHFLIRLHQIVSTQKLMDL
jgi:hypothetical protein